MEELYKRYRPKTLSGLVGQQAAVATVQKLVGAKKVPHCLLLTGPSGVGKTTIARILKSELQCGDADYSEKNCADFRGIDDVREIRRSMNFLPIAGSVRMWLIDECHKLTGDAQNSMLKMLEDTPAHVYFLLCTTDPQKLIKTIRTRATEIKLVPLSHQELEQLIKRVVQKEGFKVSDDIVEEIAEASDGSARKALVLLEQIADLDSEEGQLKAIVAANFNKDDAFTLARLVFNFRRDATWTEIAKTLRNLSDQDVEGIRYCMLGYARSVLVGKDEKPPNTKYAQKAFGIIEIFGRNFYDSKHAGLAGACWEAFNNLK
jgi:DNA polymerase III gamma/tau subunit